MFQNTPTPLRDISDVTPVSTGSFALWQPFKVEPQLISIGVAALLVLIAGIYFYIKVKNVKPNESLSGFALMIESFVNWVRALIADIMGIKFVKLTPYFIYLFVYIALTNLTSIIGLEPAATSYTIPLSMGLVTFIGIFVFGVKYQRWSFLNKYMFYLRVKGKTRFAIINPLELLNQVTPLISITFRLWGNITAGSIILTLFYGITALIVSYIPALGIFNFLGGALAPFLHLFFDMLEGVIQAFVFTLLTATYWGIEANAAEDKLYKATQEQVKTEDELLTKSVAAAT